MLISCENTAFGYEGHRAVRGLTFSVNEGDFLCVAGENGSGKTTLVRGLLRLLKPLEGTISFSPLLAANDTGYLSQETITKKDFPAGVFEIVLSGNLGKMGLRPFYNKAEKKKAEENLEKLGITELKNRCFRELSGGQKRRVLLARSLCASEKLLVLDEPFAGLDPFISAELCGLLKKLNRELGITVIMVSHDIEAADAATSVLHLAKQQLFFGGVKEYRQSQPGRKFFAKKETANDYDTL